MSLKSKLNESANYIKNILSTKNFPTPKVAIILGSGAKSFSDNLENKFSIPVSDVPNMISPRVLGHGTDIDFGYVSNIPVMVYTGRIHYYEGYSVSEVVYAVRVAGTMNIKNLIQTNASGGLHKGVNPETVYLIKDHINLTSLNCLIGKEEGELGDRFLSLEDAYSKEWRQRFKKIDSSIQEVIYLGATGPSYETPAETKYLQIIGADVAGMSTVQETLAAKQLGMNVLGLSTVTNYCCGVKDIVVSHQEVLMAGKKTSDKLKRAVYTAIESLE